MQKYRVKEIFGATIQGEGTFSGTVVNFLRLAGCNRWSGLEKAKADSICNFCDTDFFGGDKLTKEEIVAGIKSLGNDIAILVISGGEPTIQLTEELCSFLVLHGYRLHLETNGSNNIDHLFKYFEHITMSPKQTLEETKLSRCHDLKMLWPPIAVDITPEKFSRFTTENNYLQPIFKETYDQNLSDAISKLKELKSWRLSLQTHKIIGVQ